MGGSDPLSSLLYGTVTGYCRWRAGSLSVWQKSRCAGKRFFTCDFRGSKDDGASKPFLSRKTGALSAPYSERACAAAVSIEPTALSFSQTSNRVFAPCGSKKALHNGMVLTGVSIIRLARNCAKDRRILRISQFVFGDVQASRSRQFIRIVGSFSRKQGT